ncbi:MAG: Rrf2 family transcriptional regulator, partial [Candidatus Cloacimonetes bacterium]|nr:Rrf2 family transcriptional regulator [Candidatus Cloacimonadota bacterium]
RICQMQHLPRKYIEQIFLKLRHKGLLNASHGAAGGYYLSRPFAEITLADVIHAVDDEVSSKFCPENERKNEYCSGFPCGFSRIWDEITKDLESYFNSITLENILSKL